MGRLRSESFYTRPLSKAANAIKSVVRRVSVIGSSSGLWQTEGAEGEADDSVEVFGVGGFYSRPEADDAEAILAKVGGGQTGVIVATRDETARQAVSAAKDLGKGETIMFAQSGAYVHISKDGAISIRASGGNVNIRTDSGGKITLDDGGGAEPLVTLSEFLAHIHKSAVGPTSPPDPVPTGTTVVMGK